MPRLQTQQRPQPHLVIEPTADVIVNWSNLISDTIYLGGISHNTPEGLISLTIINIAN